MWPWLKRVTTLSFGLLAFGELRDGVVQQTSGLEAGDVLADGLDCASTV
jgi:hypothetical protein